MKIGYWNINKKNLKEIGVFIVDLIAEHNLDVLLLSEFNNLNKKELADIIPNEYMIVETSGLCDKVLTIVKRSTDYKSITEGKRYIILKSNKCDLVIVGLHLSDRRNYPQSLKRIDELNNILESIKHVNCSKYIFVGDFNSSPFDDELTCCSGMHSVLFKKEMNNAEDGKVKHYNPMLLVLEEQKETYGSYRYIDSTFPLYWYSFDQVIVSKQLMNSICDIKYLKMIKGKTLMSKSDINPVVSDHLPLIFKIGDK